METSRDYALLLVDVRGSTSLPPERIGPAMRRVEDESRRLSRRFKDSLALGLSLSYGDEIAGLFRSTAPLYQCVVALREALHPDTGLRFVVSEGRIGVVSDDIRKVGGPVFKTADEAMDSVKSARLYGAWLLADARLSTVLDSLTRLSNEFVERMTAYQRAVYRGLRAGTSLSGIAEALGKHRQSVSDAARRGGAGLVIEAERSVDALLTGAALHDARPPLTSMTRRLLEEMTEYQRAVYDCLTDGLSRAETAEALGKHRQSVSDAAKRGAADLLIEAERVIGRLTEDDGGTRPAAPGRSHGSG